MVQKRTNYCDAAIVRYVRIADIVLWFEVNGRQDYMVVANPFKVFDAVNKFVRLEIVRGS